MVQRALLDETPKVWLIDRRGWWRGEVCRALDEAGYETQEWEDYVYPPTSSQGRYPDLVVVSGTRIGDEEDRLIREVLAKQHRLVVVSGQLSDQKALDLLRAGALDAAEVPPDRTRIVSMVRNSLENDDPVSGYEAVARGMAIK